jgi:N-acetylmuramoyl-L-alanine amidase
MTALALAAALLAATPADIDVERISFDRSRDGATTVARVHASAPVRAYSVDQDGTTVELVLYRARLARGLERERAEGAVRAYRVEADEDRVTVRFELEPGVRVRAYPDRDSDDLLLSLSPGAAPVARAVPRRPGGGVSREPVFRPAREPVRQPVASRPVAPAGPVPGVTPREAVAAAAPAPAAPGSPHWRLDTVVLDAGHGAHDYGARANGTSDKEVAFEVVRRLGPMIERELGVRVVYTREDDSFVELRERGRIANRSGGKLFISVHANAGPPSAHGTETFFLAPRGSKSAREVMERENSVIELESNPELYADFDDEGDILRSLAMSAYQEESQELARLIEGEFRAAGRHSRGVKQNNFIVLWAASMPAVLVEVGFVTNRAEARYLSSAEGQEETARALFEAVRAYKERYERGLHAVAGS